MGKYVVIEIQTDSEGQVSNLVSVYDDENQAKSKYHTVLSYAAVSNLPVHACTILSNEGFNVKDECYKHNVVATPVVNNEEEE